MRFSFIVFVVSVSVLVGCGEGPQQLTFPVCGNGVLDAGEACDGAELNGGACPAGLTGAVTCTDECTLDTSACGGTACNGNGVIDGDEACDGLDLGGHTCTSQGFASGVLACTSSCTLDVSGCCQHVCALGDGRCAASRTGRELCQQGANGCLGYATLECQSGEICVDDPAVACVSCQSDCSDADAQRCVGDHIERCVDVGGGCLQWNEVEDCAASGLLCDDSVASGAECAPCLSACASVGDTRCAADLLETCALDANGCRQWHPSIDCTAQGQVCYGAPLLACANACVDLCGTEGKQVCDGATIFACERQPTGCLAPVAVVDCSATGNVCNESPAGAACASVCADACTQGARRCVGKIVQSCEIGALGCLVWRTHENCADSQSTCNDNGGAVACVCEDTCSSAGSTRCNLNRVETCDVQANGCLQYGVTSDCASQPGNEGCYDGVQPAVCAPPAGNSCQNAIALVEGDNVVPWTSTEASVLFSAPSCVNSGGLSGPDVVMSYQAPGDGYVTFEVQKPVNNRWVMVVAGSDCNMGQELACGSSFDEAMLRATAPVSAGEPIKVVLRDHLAGAATLSKPLAVNARYATCLDNCEQGAPERCTGDSIEACMLSPEGCWEWTSVTDCGVDASGPYCFDGGAAPTCRSCLDSCDAIGAGRCAGNQVELCALVDGGCKQWTPGTTCAAGEVCRALGNTASCGVQTGESCSTSIILHGGVNVVTWTANSLDHLPQGQPVSCGIDYYNYIDLVFQYVPPPGVTRIRWSVVKNAGHEMAVEVSSGPCGTLSPIVSCDEEWTGTTITNIFNVTPGTTYTFYMVDTVWNGNQLPPTPLTWTIVENP